MVYDTTALCIRKTESNMPKSSFFLKNWESQLTSFSCSSEMLPLKVSSRTYGLKCQIQLIFSLLRIFCHIFFWVSVESEDW